jgi:hypothetical protein
MNEIPKVVFSNSLASADWAETAIAAGDLVEAITRLKQERSDGYLLAHGGGTVRPLAGRDRVASLHFPATRPTCRVVPEARSSAMSRDVVSEAAGHRAVRPQPRPHSVAILEREPMPGVLLSDVFVRRSLRAHG